MGFVRGRLCRAGAAFHLRAMCPEGDHWREGWSMLVHGTVTTIGLDLVGKYNVPLRLPMSLTAIDGEIAEAQADPRLVSPPHPRPLRVVFRHEKRVQARSTPSPTLHLSRAVSSTTSHLRSNLSHSSDQAFMLSTICFSRSFGFLLLSPGRGLDLRYSMTRSSGA
jgi:hypothetical protein